MISKNATTDNQKQTRNSQRGMVQDGRYYRRWGCAYTHESALVPSPMLEADKDILSSNCRVIEVVPNALVEVMPSTPGMDVNSRSSGLATDAAIVSGLAPGKLAVTWMVGKSTFGRSLTERLM